MGKFENTELAMFLEDAARGMFELNPNAACVVGINDQIGLAGTNYLTDSIDDKVRLLHNIFADIVMDIVLSNAHLIRDTIAELEEDDEDDGEDD